MKSSKYKKKYKALMLDVDGTTVRNEYDAIPSKKVKEAINKASKIIKVGLATSRPLPHVVHIIDMLKLSTPCIITGGAQIFDPVSKKMILEHNLNITDIKKAYEISKKLKFSFIVVEKGKNTQLNENYVLENPIQLWSGAIEPNVAEEFIEIASGISDVSVYKIDSWEKGKLDIIVTNAKATKQHGILEVAKLLNISTHEIIGVGDGYNDFPLLMACGLKVAMGNAVEDLKEIADYIAPSVDEDGVSDVIEKFVL